MRREWIFSSFFIISFLPNTQASRTVNLEIEQSKARKCIFVTRFPHHIFAISFSCCFLSLHDRNNVFFFGVDEFHRNFLLFFLFFIFCVMTSLFIIFYFSQIFSLHYIIHTFSILFFLFWKFTCYITWNFQHFLLFFSLKIFCAQFPGSITSLVRV